MEKVVLLTVFALLTTAYNAIGQVWTTYPPVFDSTLNAYTDRTEITGFAIDSSSKLLYSSGRQIGRLDGAEWTIYDHRSTKLTEMQDWNVRDIAITKDNKIIGASERGLLIFDNGEWTRLDKTNTQINNEFIQSCRVDSQNNIWLVNHGQTLYKYDWSKLEDHSIIKANKPMISLFSKLMIDNDNSVWYSGTYSVVKFDGSNWTAYDSTSMPVNPHETISSVHYSRTSGRLIVGTARGRLYAYDGQAWSDLNSPLEVTDPVAQICSDKLNNIWIAAPKKLLKLTAENVWESINLPVIGDDSLVSPVFSAMITDKDNRLIIGTNSHGIIIYDPNATAVSESVYQVNVPGVPKVHIRKIIPNPVKYSAKIEFFCLPDLIGGTTVKVIDYLGREYLDMTKDIVFDSFNASGTVNFSVGAIPDGLYYILIKNTEDNSVKPIIIIK